EDHLVRDTGLDQDVAELEPHRRRANLLYFFRPDVDVGPRRFADLRREPVVIGMGVRHDDSAQRLDEEALARERKLEGVLRGKGGGPRVDQRGRVRLDQVDVDVTDREWGRRRDLEDGYSIQVRSLCSLG